MQSITALLQWLEASSLAMFIHQSQPAFTTVQLVHVIAVALVVGTIAIVDLRLLGLGSAKRPFTELAGSVLPTTWAAFVIAVGAGALLFISQATEYAGNVVFWVKIGIMLLAGINMAAFEFLTVRGVGAWDRKSRPPLAARLAGGISLACWVLVVVCGRWIGFTLSE